MIVTGLLFGALSANDGWGQADGQAPAGPQADAKRAEVVDTSTLPVSLERIRQGVQRESKLTLESIDPNLPVFRTSVRQTPLKLEDYWKIGPDTAVADYVRPFFASQLHYDFMKMTAREGVATDPFGSFGNPLQPVGPPVLPIVNGITKGLSNIKRGRIKRQIEAELKAIEANPASPEDSQEESQLHVTRETPIAAARGPVQATQPSHIEKNGILIRLSESPRAQYGKVEYEKQSENQRIFSAIWGLEAEVNNGGFRQYFFNSDSEAAPDVPAALRAIGAQQTAAIVAEALALFPQGPPPRDRAARQRRLGLASPEVVEAWDRLDRRFFTYPDNLTELLYAWVKSRPDDFGPIP